MALTRHSQTLNPIQAARRWLTTADTARMLEVTRQGVHWLVQTRRLACETTASGQHLFREGDVLHLVEVRARARLVGRPRPQRVAIGEPRQLSLFGKARLRLVPIAESEA